MRIKAHIKLRPCKYCGGEAKIIRVFDKRRYVGICDTIFCPNKITTSYDTEHEARLAWNRKQEELDELKPCPFCGKLPEIIETYLFDDVYSYKVSCRNENCTAIADSCEEFNKKDAIKNWNCRKG